MAECWNRLPGRVPLGKPLPVSGPFTRGRGRGWGWLWGESCVSGSQSLCSCYLLLWEGSKRGI